MKQFDFAMFVVESMLWLERSFRGDYPCCEIYQAIYYSVSSKYHLKSCDIVFSLFSHRTRLDLDEFAKGGADTYPADLPVRIQAQATTDLVRIISKLLYSSVWNW